MLMFMHMYVYIHVFMSLSDRIVKDHSCGEIIAYAGEWHDEVPSYGESTRESSHDKYTRSVS